MKLTICHLYPDVMNIYGDRGNIIALQQRLKWRGIESHVITINSGDALPTQTVDIYFFGGGQDQAQSAIAKDLTKHADTLRYDVEDGAVLISVCGGYQLLGKYYLDQDGRRTPGIGLFDVETKAGTRRMVGNISISLGSMLPGEKVIGFENHSGRTYLGKGAKPFGHVLAGFGNNGEDKTEGVVYKNAIGTYLHGSLLPKNPKLTDYFLQQAVTRKDPDFVFNPLESSVEKSAFDEALGRF